MRNISKILMVAVLAVSSVSLSACNTIEGAGRDVERTGESIQGAAD